MVRINDFIIFFILCYRHVVSAAHCICSRVSHVPNSDFLCRPPSENQLLDTKNEIKILAGSKRVSVLNIVNWGKSIGIKQKADQAYVMDEFVQNPSNDYNVYDIGIIVSETKPFFDKKSLRNIVSLGKAYVVPVCLAAINTNINEKVLRMAGWGVRYEETPDRSSNEEPILSSCMTNQASPNGWKFQNCDMKDLKHGSGKATFYECHKKSPPPSFDASEDRICKEYFEKAGKVEDPYNSPKLFKETRLGNIDKMYIVDERGNKVKTCYSPKRLSQNGWCKLNYQSNGKGLSKTSWGICSSSCDSRITGVNKIEIINDGFYLYLSHKT